MKTFNLNYFGCNATDLELHVEMDYETLYLLVDAKTDSNTVSLLAVGEEDVFISDDKELIKSCLQMYHNTDSFVEHFESDYQEIYLQQYSSYEEAYKVALTMKETSRLCYNNGNLN